MTAAIVAETIILGWVSLFGAPHSLHTDRGSQFTSSLFREVCALLSVRKSQTTPYHPQGNGQVERVNKTIVQMLRVDVHGNERSWDKALPSVMLSFRTAVHRSTGFTPCKMMFGSERRLPVDLGFDLPETVVRQSSSQFALFLEDLLRTCFLVARQSDSSIHIVQQDYYNRKVSGSEFGLDDHVWLFDMTVPTGSGEKKLKWPWKRPFVITACPHPVYDISSLANGTTKRVNFNRLKPCRSRLTPTEPLQSQSSNGPDVPFPDDPSTSILSWPDDLLPPQPPPPPAPPPVHPRAHLWMQASLPGYLHQYVVPRQGQR